MFYDKYVNIKEIKSEIKNGFYIYLRPKPLNNIIEKYSKKIFVLDTSGKEGEIHSTKIKSHNNKYQQ